MNRNEDLSENLNYTASGLPILTSNEDMSDLAPSYRELVHWHEDLEFILVTKGTLDFDVNGEILHIQSNQGLFVNSGRLHYGYSEKMQEVLFKLIIISPDVIRNCFNFKAINDIVSPHNTNYRLFHKNMLIWTLLERIHIINQEQEQNYIFDLQAEICLLMKELSIMCSSSDKNESKDTTAMKQMLSFIQKHYQEKITISDIAASAMICRNQCFKIFQQMQITPQQYLIQYRINQSLELLKRNINISDIAQLCGFCSQSHYTKSFKSIYGVTPKQYIK